MSDVDLSGLLSPDLYALLVANFGEVRPAAEGCPMYTSIVMGARGPELQVLAFGEAYRIRCPFCREQRHRLWINHRYGQPHPITGRSINNWAVCFNETSCMDVYANRETLHGTLFKLRNRNAVPSLRLNDAAIVTGPPPPALPPAVLVPLHEAPHAANYLLSRNLGPELWHQYGAMYCVDAGKREWWPASRRIYVPIWFEGRYVGWQTRYVGEPPHGTPKYYTMPLMRKSQILYNYDNARGKPFVVVFEGVTHVWRFGNYGVGLLGKSMSPIQRMLLQSAWSNREPIVIVLDPDARDNSAQILQELINTGTNPVVLVDLPDGMDAADFDRVALWNIIYAQAARRGITLPPVPLY